MLVLVLYLLIKRFFLPITGDIISLFLDALASNKVDIGLEEFLIFFQTVTSKIVLVFFFFFTIFFLPEDIISLFLDINKEFLILFQTSKSGAE
jgi:hypothetical protein